MAWIVRERDAPLEGRAADGEIVHAGFEFAEDFIAAGFGLDEFGVGLNVLEDARKIFAEAEEVRWLLVAHQRLAVEREEVALLGLGFGDEFFLAFIVPAFVGAE